MAYRKTVGYRAELERKKTATRIRALENILANEKLERNSRKKFENMVDEMRAVSDETRTYKDGKRIVGRSQEDIEAALSRLTELNESATVYTGDRRRGFLFTQNQLNMASVDAEGSVYTKAEAKIFYRATQKAWQREGIGEHERNEAILQYYGRTNLAAFVEEVLNMNKLANDAAKVLDERRKHDSDDEGTEEAQRNDTSDGEKGSPTYMTLVITMEEYDTYIKPPTR